MAYNDSGAFRRALETRLLAQSRQSVLALFRLRKLVAFDRFLARLAAAQPGDCLLKGGVAMQLRLGSLARTTKDIDLLPALRLTAAYQMLVQVARLDLGDWFEFTVIAHLAPAAGHEIVFPDLAAPWPNLPAGIAADLGRVRRSVIERRIDAAGAATALGDLASCSGRNAAWPVPPARWALQSVPPARPGLNRPHVSQP
jgi:hypothetical protein